jgi:hypothetical protein
MSIRLTLRTLLSYLDDTLEPAQAKVIGAKVAESEQARELMERIKQVTRRRRLMTPANSGPGGIDPNTIAEYLDNDVTPEQAAEVEQICLASDVHLAEVAACHQILTLVLGEPALVPPSAKQRMYGLTKGPEAIPFRKPSKAASRPENDLSSEIEPDQDETLRLGVPAVAGNGGQRNFLLLIGGGALVVCLLFIAVWQLTHSGPAVPPTPKGGDQQVAKADDKAKEKNDAPKDGADAKPDTKKDQDDVKPPAPKDKQIDRNPDDAQPKVVDVPPPVAVKIANAPASDKQVAVGKHIQFNPKDLAVLLQMGKSDKAGWTRVPNTAAVMSGRPLLSLPGSKSVVILETGIELTLWGNLPEVSLDPTSLESRVVLHAHDQLDADLTLQRGRLIIRNKTDKDALVRVRFNNPTLNEENHFDLTLYGKEAALILELHGEMGRDEPFYDNPKDKMRKGPTAIMNIFVYDKSVRVSSDDAAFSMDEGQQPMLRWQSRLGALGPPEERTAPPPWFKGTPPLKNPEEKQVRAKYIKAAEELSDSLAKDKRAVDVALIESIQDAQDAFQRDVFAKKQISMDTNARWRYGVRCLRGIDKVDLLFAIFANDATPSFIRGECMNCLQQWLALGRDNDYQLLAVVREKYPMRASTKIMELFHLISVEDARNPGTYQVLIEGLNNDLLPIRFLSASHLYPLAPIGMNISYDAAMPRPDREAAVRAWLKLVPPGQMPQPPKKK